MEDYKENIWTSREEIIMTSAEENLDFLFSVRKTLYTLGDMLANGEAERRIVDGYELYKFTQSGNNNYKHIIDNK